MELSDESNGRSLHSEDDFILSSGQQRNVSLADETDGRWLGPMPPEEFLSKLLPLPNGAPASKEIRFEDVAAAENEGDIATRFIKAANEADLPRLSFVNASTPRSRRFDKLGPDVTGISDKAHVRSYRPKTVEERKAFVDFGYSELIVECKSKGSDDAFNDHDQDLVSGSLTKELCAEEEETPDESTPLPFEDKTPAARATRGQLATYTTAQSGSQFRTHSFSLFIFGPFARFIRWDRSCAIVSARFEYGTSPNNSLAEFLHRYSLLDDEGRGKDLTFAPEPCSDGDCPHDMAEQLHKTNKSKLTPAILQRRTELRTIFISDLEDSNIHHPYIIAYPLPFVPRSPFGRATCPFLTYNPATQGIVFVKDFWRSTAQGISQEGDIYDLEEKGVRHIPPFSHGNDSDMAGSGLLIDWDSSTIIPDTGSFQAERTGTWGFMSAALLTSQDRSHHAIEDDRESSFYVILYGALRYSQHQGGEQAAAHLEMFNESRICSVVGLPTGGDKKALLMLSKKPYPIEFNPLFDALVAGAARFFRPRYDAVTEKEKVAYHKIKASGIDHETLNEGTIYGQHLAGLKRMQARGTWTAFLREKLKEDGWPDKDFHIQKLESISTYH